MSSLKIELPDDVSFILDRMRSNGYAAYVVGGSVRDSFIGRELGDFDITTNAKPEQIKSVFSDFKTVDTGIKHGTVTLILSGAPYEITTYRVDGDYKDARHPESVTFTDRLEDDLARRDFTVNAMAYNPNSGVVDRFGGRDDVKAKLIRAVGDPRLRFMEDALRILRALRFASVLGFDVEPKTKAALIELSGNLAYISKERVYAELKKLIMGVDAVRILTEYSSVFEIILDGLKINAMPNSSLFDKADIYTRISSLILLNSPDPTGAAERILSGLKTDKFTRTHIVSVLTAYQHAAFSTETATLTAVSKYGVEVVGGALALGTVIGRYGEYEQEVFAAAIKSGMPYSVSGLAVRGGDLVAAGITGEAVGATLEMLLCSVINREVENNKEALMEYLEEKK